MAGVLYVAVVSRVLGLADAAFHLLPRYLRPASTRRSICTPKEDSSAGEYAGGATSRNATATPFGSTTPTKRFAKRNVESKTTVAF
ncbi:hypothetical protein KRP22_005760 [Phytophthora ramorum]|uniref:uncharacterized protein n=1 Tax=Phytophthora ramorum TaxID=164328 RepID=UPI0030AA315F|nr:hypothetical protein KRP23_3656 [Phytophthora ramorum]KAH7508015.1 hypothetical protein KRP22_3108 [Phytophthora ramorum]